MARGLASAIHCSEKRQAGEWNILEGQGWSHFIATVPTHPPGPTGSQTTSVPSEQFTVLATTKPFPVNLSPGNQILRINSGTKIRVQTSKKFYHHAKIKGLHLAHFAERQNRKLQHERLPTVTVAAHCQICPYKLVLIRSQTTGRKFKWGLCDLDSWFPFLGVKPIKIFYPDSLFLFGEFVVCQECQLFI